MSVSPSKGKKSKKGETFIGKTPKYLRAIHALGYKISTIRNEYRSAVGIAGEGSMGDSGGERTNEGHGT